MKQKIVFKIPQILFIIMGLSFFAGAGHARDISKTVPLSGAEKNAAKVTLLNSGREISIDHLAAGGQAVIRGLSDTIFFAGHNIGFVGFSGVMGRASDTAYIMVAQGRAHIGGQEAVAGEIFILLPYGGEIIKQYFDAARFIDAWSEEDRLKNSSVLMSLRKIARAQSRAMFFGRYEATAFNVSAPGTAEQESARRSIVGANIIQKIRFSGERDPEKIEHHVVSEYARALITGDADTLAALSDPTPYGTFDLRGGADGARLLMAKQILKQQDWPGLIAGAQFVKSKEGQNWVLKKPEGTVSVMLRPIGDFIYVTNILWEARK